MNGSVGLTEARMAVSPEGFVYIGGSYTSDLLQSLNNQTDSTFSNGRVDGFVCGISPNGKISFINTIGGPQNDYVNSLHTSDDSHFFVGGNYSDTCYFDKSNLKNFHYLLEVLMPIVLIIQTMGNLIYSLILVEKEKIIYIQFLCLIKGFPV